MADGARFFRLPFQKMLEVAAQIDRPRIRTERCLAAGGILPIPALSFGDTELEQDAIQEQPARGSWRDRTVASSDAFSFILDDVLVHGPDGIITVGDLVIEETLAHNPLNGVQKDGDSLVFPALQAIAELPLAHYGMGSGYYNQFHWLFEVLPRLQVSPFADGAQAGALLFPPLETQVQRDVAALCRAHGREVVSLGAGEVVRVKKLIYVPNLSGFGFAPHVLLGPFFERLTAALNVSTGPARKVYVSRLGSNRRRLVNEDQVAALVAANGFEAVVLENMNLCEQAECFADATHIVSAHGAGLANLIFCKPGASVCELQMDRYVHWCFRRLAGLRSVRYGCLIGLCDEHEALDLDVHQRTWRAPLDRLEAVLNDPRFLAGSASAGEAAAPQRTTQRLQP